ARRNLPRGQGLIDVGIERELALLDEMERRHRSDRLAHAAGLEQGLRSHWTCPKLRDAEALRPFNGAIVDDGDADARHMERSHAFLELSTSVSVVLLHDLRREARGDLI